METNVSKVEVFQGKDDQWYWRGKSANGEVVATSEAYAQKFNALRAVSDTWPTEIPVVVVES